MLKKQTLSIVSANYNNAVFLDDFFASIANSTELPDELIFVDDASTDSSVSIAEQWKQNVSFPIRIIAIEINMGFANALNVGVESSCGDLILRVDPDDFIHPQRIEKEIAFLENHPNIQIAGSNTFYYNDYLKKVVGVSNFPVYNKSIVNLFKKGKIGISNGSFTARRAVFDHAKYCQDFIPYEEYVFFSQLLSVGVVAQNCPEALTYYRIHKQIRSLYSFLSKNRGVRSVQEAIWGSRFTGCSFIIYSLSSYIYWKYLKAQNPLLRIVYFLGVLPFKINGILKRLL